VTTAAVDLRLDEAVELGHAWLQSLAESRGIRVLFIKGPALHHYGLRHERVSSDVDALVEPRRFAEFCEAIERAGWREREGIFISDRTTLHSRAYIRDGWPCDLDIHGFYPGFLADPVDAFDALWRRRARLSYAGRLCEVPDRVGAMLILALHSLRGTSAQSRHLDELERLVRIELTARERADAAALALATGSAATLETVLPRWGVDVKPPPEDLASHELREWRERVASGSYGAYFWLLALRHARGKDRAVVAWRAVWPTRHDLLLARSETIDTLPGRTRARAARWVRGIRSLPRAIRALRTGRQIRPR
jgi:hypothetical protein